MKWTEAEYLAMEAQGPVKHEFLDGEIYAMAGAKPGHNAVCANTLRAPGNLVYGGPCGTFTSDQRIPLKPIARPADVLLPARSRQPRRRVTRR